MKAQTITLPRLFCILWLMTLVTGCSSTAKKVFNEKTYTLGSSVTVDGGNLIASELQGEVETKRSWVGIMNSDDGWGPAKLEFSDDYLEKKLFYLGYEKPYIYLLYREYRKGELEPWDQIEKFNATENPFIQINDFYLESLGLKGIQKDTMPSSQVKFNILNKESFDSKKTDFAVAKKRQEELDALNAAIETIKQARKEASDAKQLAEQVTQITSTSDSFSNALNEFNSLNEAFDEVNKKENSVSQLIKIYRAYEEKFSQFAAYFTPVAIAVEAWSAMDEDFRSAVQAGISKDYFKLALELQVAGELDLQEARYGQAKARFIEAREETARISDHVKNQTTVEETNSYSDNENIQSR